MNTSSQQKDLKTNKTNKTFHQFIFKTGKTKTVIIFQISYNLQNVPVIKTNMHMPSSTEIIFKQSLKQFS